MQKYLNMATFKVKFLLLIKKLNILIYERWLFATNI